MKRLAPCVALWTWICVACGGGTPVRVVVDELATEVDLGAFVDKGVSKVPLLRDRAQPLPELWPESLPVVRFQSVLATPPIAVDLTPEPGSAMARRYEQINRLNEVVRRIEFNRVVLRIDQSSLTVGLPEAKLQIADDIDADPDDRMAWQTIGTVPSAPPGFVGDLELRYLPGGESYLYDQMANRDKEFALRLRSRVDYELTGGTALPRGKAKVRLIVVATFFVDPVRYER